MQSECSSLQRLTRRKMPSADKALHLLQLNRLKRYPKVVGLLKEEALVEARSQQVSSALSMKFSRLAQEQVPLRVICVSNTEYAKHLLGPVEDELPFTLQTTGIPDLRLYTSVLPSRRRSEIVSYHWRVKLPELVARVDIWCKQSAMPRQRELREIVETPLRVCRIPFT